jgi:uncharacterized protein YggE
MKSPIKYLLLTVVLACPLAQAFGQVPGQPPLISVSGSAEVKVAPDEINLRVGVETRGRSLDEAKRENDDAISKSLAFLKGNGVKEKDIQTDFISIDPEYGDSLSRTVVTYVVRRSIQARLAKIDSFESVLTGLLTNGVNTVLGIEFRTSQLRKYRDQARAMAIKAAREKADAMASELGVKRGKVYSVSANDWGGWYGDNNGYWGRGFGGGGFQYAMQNAGGGSEGEGTLSAGQISVSATVNVSFLIE